MRRGRYSTRPTGPLLSPFPPRVLRETASPLRRSQIMRDVALLGTLSTMRARLSSLLSAAPRGHASALAPLLSPEPPPAAPLPSPSSSPAFSLALSVAAAAQWPTPLPLVVPGLRARARGSMRAAEICSHGRQFMAMWGALGVAAKDARTGKLISAGGSGHGSSGLTVLVRALLQAR